MTKIAVDVALLLPEEINKICININQKDNSDYYSDLSKKNNHFHITLAMGVIDEEDIEKVNSMLGEISRKFSKINLRILRISYKLNNEGKKSYVFEIQLTDELKKLHAMVMKELLPIFSYEVGEEMFFLDSDENFTKISKSWVEDYGKNHTGPENYHPHISLKCRRARYDKTPINFIASDIALCHLGNHCTCREILGSFKL